MKKTRQKNSGAGNELVPIERVERSILFIRGQKVMLDSDLAALFGVPTFRFNEAIKRNRARFPSDFMFQLSRSEHAALTSQIAISKKGRGGRRTQPYAFTEHGAVMAANILNSKRAIEISVLVVRAFVRLRTILATHEDLARKIAELERHFEHKTDEHADHIRRIYEILDALMDPPPDPPRKPIGFATERDTQD